MPRAVHEQGSGHQEVVLSGDPPSPLAPPQGCRFHPRCPRVQERCRIEPPVLAARAGDSIDHVSACHFPLGDDERLLPVASVAAV
jgi:oligopeptide/dipeptide ABC transporter ATP-binding protein